MAKKKNDRSAPAVNAAQKRAKDKKSPDKTMKKAVIAVAAVAVFCITLILLTAFGVIRIPGLNVKPVPIGMASEGDADVPTQPKTSEDEKPVSLDPEDGMSDEEINEALDDLLVPVDADAYFDEIGTVKEKISARSFENVTNEAKTRKLMSERGFGEYAIYYEYDMDGNYHTMQEIGSGSSSHPVYELVYLDSQDRQWMVFLTNGVIHAVLVDYAVEHPEEPPVIVTETDTLMGYDSTTNTFYEYIPKDGAAAVTKVEGITAEALDRFTV